MGTFRTIAGGAVILAIASQVVPGLSGSKALTSEPATKAAAIAHPSSHIAPQLPTKPYVSEDERATILAQATRKLKRTRDQMEKVSFYGPPGISSARTEVAAYIGVADGGAPYVRMKAGYTGDRWIFFDRIKIMADDQIILEKTFRRSEITRDNAAGSVWEIADLVAEAPELDALEKISHAKSATIRYSGRDRIHDHKINSREKAALQSVLTAYNTLKQKL